MNLREQAVVSVEARIASGVVIGPFCVLHADVWIEEGVELGSGVVLHPGARLGRGVRVQDHAVIGKLPVSPRTASLGAQGPVGKTVIEEGSLIGTGAVIYAGCRIGPTAFIGDGASLRENCTVGTDSTLGRGVSLEFGVRIGRDCLVFTGTYLSEEMLVENEVFLGACVCSAAGKAISFRRPIPTQVESPIVRRGARVGTGVVLHPGVEVGPEAVVAAGSVVFETVPAATLVLGNPARPVRRVAPDEFLPGSALLR